MKQVRREAGDISILLPDLRVGGAERVSVNLANEFASRGLAVDMLLMGATGGLISQLDSRVRLVDLRTPRVRDVLPALYAYLKREKPTALIANMWPLTLIAPLARSLARVPTRVVGVEHTTWSASERANEKRFMAWLRLTMSVASRLADRVVAVSSGAADDMARLASIRRENVSVVYNPIISLHRLERDSVVQPLSSKGWAMGGHKKIIAVGTLKKIKDYPTLLRAFSQVRRHVDAKLLILGEGGERAALETLTRELGVADAVFMPGSVGDPSAYLECADLHVLSSVGEGFGNVIVEALQQGTPVVSTDCPSGPREILVDGRYGALVPVGNPEALAAAVCQSLQSAHDHDALRARARDFSIDKAADVYLDLLIPDWRGRVRALAPQQERAE